MLGHRGSSAGSYLADPTSPSPRTVLSLSCSKCHSASIALTGTLRVKNCIAHWSVWILGVILHYSIYKLYVWACGWVERALDSTAKDPRFNLAVSWTVFNITCINRWLLPRGGKTARVFDPWGKFTFLTSWDAKIIITRLASYKKTRQRNCKIISNFTDFEGQCILMSVLTHLTAIPDVMGNGYIKSLSRAHYMIHIMGTRAHDAFISIVKNNVMAL